MADPFLEIELRYSVHDVAACLQRLAELGVAEVRKDHLIDQWYLPDTIRNLQEEQEWFDVQHGIAWRIRRANGKLEVTSKQLTEHNSHNSFHETTADFASHEDAVQAMNERNYRNWLTIDKTRYVFTSRNPEINNDEFELVLDHIVGLADKIGVGACVEIEFKGKATRDEALLKIQRVAKLLGFTSKDQIEKSLTVLSMTALANFEN